MPSTKSKRRSRKGVEQDDTTATGGVYHCLGHKCDKQYDTLHSIKRHIRNKHLQHSIFVCLEGAEKCDYHTDRRDAHFKHLIEAHPGKYEYECEKTGCQKAFPTLQALQEHLPCFPYECRLDGCALNFPHYRSRESHQREDHPHIDLIRHQVDTYIGLGPRPTAISVIPPSSTLPPQLTTTYSNSSSAPLENHFSQESSAVLSPLLSAGDGSGNRESSTRIVSSGGLLRGSSFGPSSHGADGDESLVDSETVRSETPFGTGSGFGEPLPSHSGEEDIVGSSSGPFSIFINPPSKDGFHCTFDSCEKEYGKLEALKRHIKLVHLRVGKCLEEGCETTNDSQKAHFAHMKKSHPGMYEYSCDAPFCRMAYSTMEALEAHRPCNPSTCTVPGCGKRFGNHQQLSSHFKSSHPEVERLQDTVDRYVGLGPRLKPALVVFLLPPPCTCGSYHAAGYATAPQLPDDPSTLPPQLTTTYSNSSSTHLENHFSQETSAVWSTMSGADGAPRNPGSSTLIVSSGGLLPGSSFEPLARGPDEETVMVDSETVRSETPCGAGSGFGGPWACGPDAAMVDSETIRSETPCGTGSGFSESLSSSSPLYSGGGDIVALSSGPSMVAAEVHNIEDTIRYIRPGVFEFRVQHVATAPDHQAIHKETLVFKDDAYLNAQEGVVMTPDNSEMAAEPRYWLDGDFKTPFRRTDTTNYCELIRSKYRVLTPLSSTDTCDGPSCNLQVNWRHGWVIATQDGALISHPRLCYNCYRNNLETKHLPLMRVHYKIPEGADTLVWLRALMVQDDCPFTIPQRNCAVCQHALTPENCDLIVSKDPFRPLMYFYLCQGCMRSKGVKRRSGFDGFCSSWACNKYRGFGSKTNARATALMLAFQPAVVGSLEFTDDELSVLIERSRNAQLVCFYTGRPLSFELPRSQTQSLSIDRTAFVDGRSLPYWHKDQVMVSTGRFLNCFFEDLTMEERLWLFEDLDLNWDQRNADGDRALCRVERLWRQNDQESDARTKSDGVEEMEKDSKDDDDYGSDNDDYSGYEDYDDDDDDDDWLRVRGKTISWQERYRAFCDGKTPGRVQWSMEEYRSFLVSTQRVCMVTGVRMTKSMGSIDRCFDGDAYTLSNCIFIRRGLNFGKARNPLFQDSALWKGQGGTKARYAVGLVRDELRDALIASRPIRKQWMEKLLEGKNKKKTALTDAMATSVVKL